MPAAFAVSTLGTTGTEAIATVTTSGDPTLTAEPWSPDTLATAPGTSTPGTGLLPGTLDGGTSSVGDTNEFVGEYTITSSTVISGIGHNTGTENWCIIDYDADTLSLRWVDENFGPVLSSLSFDITGHTILDAVNFVSLANDGNCIGAVTFAAGPKTGNVFVMTLSDDGSVATGSEFVPAIGTGFFAEIGNPMDGFGHGGGDYIPVTHLTGCSGGTIDCINVFGVDSLGSVISDTEVFHAGQDIITGPFEATDADSFTYAIPAEGTIGTFDMIGGTILAGGTNNACVGCLIGVFELDAMAFSPGCGAAGGCLTILGNDGAGTEFVAGVNKVTGLVYANFNVGAGETFNDIDFDPSNSDFLIVGETAGGDTYYSVSNTAGGAASISFSGETTDGTAAFEGDFDQDGNPWMWHEDGWIRASRGTRRLRHSSAPDSHIRKTSCRKWGDRDVAFGLYVGAFFRSDD